MASESEGTYHVCLVGDSAVSVSFEGRIISAVNTQVVQLAAAIRRTKFNGVRDVVESYSAVTVHFDPLLIDVEQLLSAVAAEADQAATPTSSGEGVASSSERTIIVPVCYEEEFAPDLQVVAAAARCDEQEVVRRHTARTYRVYMLGFLPGFAYMASVDSTIAVPRRPAPRLRVPAGSIGIAGVQTGVYPLTAPGGWQLIGRTPLIIFDLERSDPFLFHPGDRVQFEAVAPETFAELSATG